MYLPAPPLHSATDSVLISNARIADLDLAVLLSACAVASRCDSAAVERE